MTRVFKILISVLFVIGLTSCSEAEKQGVVKQSRSHSVTFPYQVGTMEGLSIENVENDHYALKGGDGGFRLLLTPVEGDSWDMRSVSILGLMMKNTGDTEMVLDLMLGNDGATNWSNSSLGRTVIKPGEELPLGVVLYRGMSQYSNAHYAKMSGKPNGHRRHWHTINPALVRNLRIESNSPGQHRFEIARMFPLQAINNASMLEIPFIDKYGQYMHADWPGKVNADQDFASGISAEKELASELDRPTGFSKYGGWKMGPRFEATGFFHTTKYKGKWWFVDPDGYLFWSHGVTGVGAQDAGMAPLRDDLSIFAELPTKDDPGLGQFLVGVDVEGHDYSLLEDVPHYDFTRANLYRKYGEDWNKRFIAQTVKRLQYSNLNTIGAWSDPEIISLRKVPYTAIIHYEYAFAAGKLPDPFDPATRAGLRKSLREYPVDFKDDPWLLGVFVNNELRWENDSRALIASIMGYSQEASEVKTVFQTWLKNKYVTIDAFNKAWHTDFQVWEDLLTSKDKSLFKQANDGDCRVLASLFAEAYFKMVNEELSVYSPNHLYLGCRFNLAGTEVLQAAEKYVDVISANLYHYDPDPDRYGFTNKPILISEFHFASTSGKNLGSGLRSAQDAVQQGRLYREFIKSAIEHEQFIGAHWFQWNDQNVCGRFDGENYNIGFFDVVDNPNVSLLRAAEECGRNLYESIK